MGIGLSSRTGSAGSYHDALEFLFARTTGGFKFGLDRTLGLLEAMGNPHRRYPSIHIAGTNGKGSSVATIATLLSANGLRVARYTSPHLIDFRERMIVGGDAIPAERVVRFVDQYVPLVEKLGATFFEATTAMAFDYFASAGTDVAVIETGLGGRLDSTNVLDPLVAGVTSIGLDHTEYLGETLEAIAFEKAGIFKAGRPAVIGEPATHIAAVLARHAEERGARPICDVSRQTRVRDVVVDAAGTSCSLAYRGHDVRLTTPLMGEHQAHNLAFSLAMLEAAGSAFVPSIDMLRSRLAGVRLPGRFQRVGKLILDVAHNPAGASVVADTVAAVRPPKPIVVLLCVLRDKDWRGMIRTLAGIASEFVFTMAPTAPPSRAWDLGEVATFASSRGLSYRAIADFDPALEFAQRAGETVVITGSFHTVGDAMSRLQLSSLPE